MPGHERTFDHVERSRRFLARLFGVCFDVIDDAFDERVRKTLFDRRVAPRFVLRRDFYLSTSPFPAKSTNRSVASGRRLKSASSTSSRSSGSISS